MRWRQRAHVTRLPKRAGGGTVVRTSATQFVERQLAGDQPREAGRDRRVDAGSRERAGEQRDEVERLDGLADAVGDLGGRHALGEQLAGAAVA